MVKTSVYLSDEEVRRLALLAEREGASQAEIVRRAIRNYQPEGRGNREFAVTGSGRGPGGSIADISEADQLSGFGS